MHKIFRYETYKIKNYFIIEAPLLNLNNPTFTLIENNLYIHLEDSDIIYYLEKIPEYILNSINMNTCFLKEISTQSGKSKTYQISLK